ncbi:MAG: hypothetical protein GWN01_09425 [Nitrosopumilaceae archaeon]|nr:hypothetical protein [Nitrosopumilaceae archaeon]NIU87829.1 hypothetical protein [Nitrosopumilaceae archaeon]NIV65211.1 hypothetical protein [Nitrosopumilaceae archaeon]NIX61727.1 hypothetical protein [Nitrosopumilaceae archaeon]
MNIKKETIDLSILDDSTISWKAKAIALTIQKHPEIFQDIESGDKVAHLCHMGADGSISVQSGLKQLENSGYLVRKVIRGTEGEPGYVVGSIWKIVTPAWKIELLKRKKKGKNKRRKEKINE